MLPGLQGVRAAGYRGYIGIEYEGSRLSEMDGIAATKAILADYPDLRAGVQLIQGIGGGGRNADLQFNIVGPELDKLTEYADGIIDKLRSRPLRLIVI